MPNEFTKQEQFLLKEYDEANKLTLHVDDLRSRLTSFFLLLSGAAAAGIATLLRNEANSGVLGQPPAVVAILLLVVGSTGVLLLRVIARLRRVQLEHFRIINNIRAYFLGKDYDLWRIVELNVNTLPGPSRHSGTYAWVLTIMMVNSVFFGVSAYLLVGRVWQLGGDSQPLGMALGVFVVFALCIAVQDWLYLRSAKPADPNPLTGPPNPPIID